MRLVNKKSMRKHYIDNLRWITILLLIPYHTAMAWNTWNEPNYIFFESNSLISSLIIFFSPYFMPLLFVLAGISTKLALQKRTCKEYLIERVKKLLIPFLLGTILIMPIMSYIGDKFNYDYNGGFFEHYAVFFTKFTDLTGADGGFSLGQFWFLLYLMVISVVGIGIIKLIDKPFLNSQKELPFWIVLILGLPLPVLSEFLSVGGKSLIEYTYLFLIGYFVLSDDRVIFKAEKHRWYLLGAGLAVTVLNLYLFMDSGKEYVTKYASEWIMIIALFGFSEKHLNFNNKASNHMKTMSFLFYIYHFIWVVFFQYQLYLLVGNNTFILFLGTILLSYIMTFISCEISIKIPIYRKK